MTDTEFNWIDEEFPIREYVCVNVDRPCQYKHCPAWHSKGDGWGRCLIIPGFICEDDE